MSAVVSLVFPHAWPHVREARAAVSAALADYPKSVRAAAVMAASELIENAIKYGEQTRDAPSVTLELHVENGRMTLTVVNGARQSDGVLELLRRVDEIANAADREELYVRRLELLVENPDSIGSSKLGLYRIGFEGGFDLDCSWVKDTVTVTATRGVP